MRSSPWANSENQIYRILNTPQFHSKRKCFFHYIHWLMFSLTLNSLLVHIKWNLDWRSVKTGNSKTYIAKVVKTFPLLFRKGFNDFFDVFKSINTNISKILFDYSFDLWINVLTRNDLLKSIGSFMETLIRKG